MYLKVNPPEYDRNGKCFVPVVIRSGYFAIHSGRLCTIYCHKTSDYSRNDSSRNDCYFIILPQAIAITDSGVYECTATNPFGNRKAWGRLLVRRQTSIVLAPVDTQVYEGQVVKFVCTAETDPLELANLKITWYKDDNVINPDMTPRIQRVWFDYSLVLSGAQPRDTGQYRCNASNGLDFAYATASLLVQGGYAACFVQICCFIYIMLWELKHIGSCTHPFIRWPSHAHK